MRGIEKLTERIAILEDENARLLSLYSEVCSMNADLERSLESAENEIAHLISER